MDVANRTRQGHGRFYAFYRRPLKSDKKSIPQAIETLAECGTVEQVLRPWVLVETRTEFVIFMKQWPICQRLATFCEEHNTGTRVALLVGVRRRLHKIYQMWGRRWSMEVLSGSGVVLLRAASVCAGYCNELVELFLRALAKCAFVLLPKVPAARYIVLCRCKFPRHYCVLSCTSVAQEKMLCSSGRLMSPYNAPQQSLP